MTKAEREIVEQSFRETFFTEKESVSQYRRRLAQRIGAMLAQEGSIRNLSRFLDECGVRPSAAHAEPIREPVEIECTAREGRKEHLSARRAENRRMKFT